MKTRLPALGAAFFLALLGITAAVAATIVATPGDTSSSSASGKSSSSTNTTTPSGMIATDEDSCADGAWMELRRADGSPFRDETDCLGYTHHGRGSDDNGRRGSDDLSNNSNGYVEPAGDNGSQGNHLPPRDNHGGRY